MRADIGQLMKQAQRMQEQMQKAQEELAGIEVTGEAGGGLVQLRMTCKHEVRKLTIDPSLVGDRAGSPSRPTTIATLRRGQCFGEVALVDQGLRSASARSASGAVLVDMWSL